MVSRHASSSCCHPAGVALVRELFVIYRDHQRVALGIGGVQPLLLSDALGEPAVAVLAPLALHLPASCCVITVQLPLLRVDALLCPLARMPQLAGTRSALICLAFPADRPLRLASSATLTFGLALAIRRVLDRATLAGLGSLGLGLHPGPGSRTGHRQGDLGAADEGQAGPHGRRCQQRRGPYRCTHWPPAWPAGPRPASAW